MSLKTRETKQEIKKVETQLGNKKSRKTGIKNFGK